MSRTFLLDSTVFKIRKYSQNEKPGLSAVIVFSPYHFKQGTLHGLIRVAQTDYWLTNLKDE